MSFFTALRLEALPDGRAACSDTTSKRVAVLDTVALPGKWLQPANCMHIHILIHPLDNLKHSGYILPRMLPIWEQDGVTFRVISDISQADGNADAAINHIDLTTIPPEYDAVFARYPVVINGRARDISKRVVSSNIVTKDDDYQGPVIVKTDRNCGGLREAEIARNSGLLRKYARSVHRRLPWYLRNELPGKQYKVFQSKREVPWAVWHNPALVVDKYLVERHDGFNWLRTWHFFGDQETLALRWSTHQIVAVPHLLGAEFVTPNIPPELRARRRELGFDFAKFDFGMVDGKAVLYDANRTPTNSSLSLEVMHNVLMKTLAPGLPSLVKRAVKPASMAAL